MTPPIPPVRTTNRPSRWGEALALAALLPIAIAVILFYGWTVSSNAGIDWVTARQGDDYNLLAEGLAKGHVSMNAKPDPALFLPAEQRPAGYAYLLDASFYRGHYYLYFGVTPALTAFLPFLALTGRELNTAAVIWLQGAAAFVAGLALLVILRRRFAPAASPLMLAVAAVVWGCGSALPVAIRKTDMYEVAVTAGMMWSTLFLLFAILAVLRPARPGRWLALASLSAGLAVGSRPNLLPGAALLGGVWAWLWWRRRHDPTLPAKAAWRWLLAAAGPVACCGAGLLLYNYLRFGHPLEFGHRYQQGSSADDFFSVRYFWHNLRLYYLTPPTVSWFFPFFSLAPEGPRPAGYIGIEPLHGQFFCLLWVGALALLGLAALLARLPGRRPGLQPKPASGSTVGQVGLSSEASAKEDDLAAVVAILAWWFLANFLVLACVSARANRYLLDFHPALVLAGCLLLLSVSTAASRSVRAAAAILGGGGAAVVVAFNLGISVQTMNFMRLTNPVGYARLERACNRLVWPLFRLTAPHFGPRAFSIVFPAGSTVPREPLISVGVPLEGSTLFVNYLTPGRAQLQLCDDIRGGPKGPEFETEPGRTRRLEIWMGSFYPPAGHPWFGAASAAEMQRDKTTVRVVLDGREIFRSGAHLPGAAPGQIAIGRRRPWASARLERFSGRIRPLAETPAWTEPAPAPGASWGYRIKLLLPDTRFGSIEPLMTVGARPTGDAIMLRYRDRASVELIHDRVGGGLLGSAVVPVDYGRPQTFEIWFNPTSVRPGAEPCLIDVIRDGRVVLAGRIASVPFACGQAAVGFNEVQSSTGRDYFNGTLLSVERADTAGINARIFAVRGERAAAIRFQLPGASDRRAQPLLDFVRADGALGLLAIRRAGPIVQLGWRDSSGWWWSNASVAAPGPDHTVEIRWNLADFVPAVAPAAGLPRLYALVVLDGGSFVRPRSKFFDAPIAGVTGWRNPWPADAVAAAYFSGRIESPPAIRSLEATRDRPATRKFSLMMRFTTSRPGRGEPLLTAGRPGAADALFVRYGSDGTARIGFDHWGSGGPVSEPVTLESDAYRMMEVEFGSGTWSESGRGRIIVRLDGRTILDAPAEFYPALPDKVDVGLNRVGMSTSDSDFSGDIFLVHGSEVGR